jgi:hypothetical protein
MWIIVGGILLAGSAHWYALKENSSGSGSKQEKKQNTRAEHRGNLDRGSPLTRTIVYFRPQEQDEDSVDVMLRAPAKTGKRDRFICTLRNVWLDPNKQLLLGAIVPDAVGMLPSPTGEWLLLWDGGSQPGFFDDQSEATTEWSVIHLQDKKRMKIAESQVDFWNGVSVIPSWANEFTVLFRDAKGKSIIDVRKSASINSHYLKPFASAGRYGPGYQWTESEGSEPLLYKVGSIHDGVVSLRQIAPALNLKWNADWPVLREEWASLLGMGLPLPPRVHGVWGIGVEASLSPDRSNMAVADRGVQKLLKHKFPSFTQQMDGVRLRVVDVVSGKILFQYEAFPKAIEYPVGGFRMRQPDLPLFTSTVLEDLRWSPDGQYLSFTVYDDPEYKHEIPAVHIIDAQTWKETLCIPNAINAFILPDSARRNLEKTGNANHISR